LLYRRNPFPPPIHIDILAPSDFTAIATMGSSSSPPLSIAIIGAGIAGITLAIALSEHNSDLSLTIYESRHEYSEISAGVGFGPNALRAMKLISPKLISAYDQVKTPNQWPEKDHLWYDFRWSDTGKIILQVESEKGFAHCNASRVHLLARLVELVPTAVKVKFGKRVIDVQEYGAGLNKGIGKTRIRFEDGTDAFADAVVGCDGIRSACRSILLGENEQSAFAVYSGKYAYRKEVEMKKAIEAIGPEVENRQMYLGEGGHVLTFAIRGGKMLNVVAFKNGAGAPWTQRQWVVPSSREALLKDFAGCGETASKILEVSTLVFIFASLSLLFLFALTDYSSSLSTNLRNGHYSTTFQHLPTPKETSASLEMQHMVLLPISVSKKKKSLAPSDSQISHNSLIYH
jgi:salicylate hydroxylase